MVDHYKFPNWSDITLSHFAMFDFILAVYHTTFMLHCKRFSVTCCTPYTDVNNMFISSENNCFSIWQLRISFNIYWDTQYLSKVNAAFNGPANRFDSNITYLFT